jgi:hypothetical protein
MQQKENAAKEVRRNDLVEKLKSTTVPEDIYKYLSESDFDYVANYYINNHN